MRRFWRNHALEGEMVECAICPGNITVVAGKSAWKHILRFHHADVSENMMRQLNEKHGIVDKIKKPKVVSPPVSKLVDRGNGFGED